MRRSPPALIAARVTPQARSAAKPYRSNRNMVQKSQAADATAILNGRTLLPNIGIPLDVNRVEEVRVNTSAVERRAQTQIARRSVKKEWQAAWLLKAVTCIDLTTLAGDDTAGRVVRLCAKARSPIRPDLLKALGMTARSLTVGAVCVYHDMIATALEALAGSAIGPDGARP